MLRNISLMIAIAMGTTACVAPPPHQHVVYRETTRSYSDAPPPNTYHEAPPPSGFSDAPPPPPARTYSEAPPPRERDYANSCAHCGTVREVERVEIRQGTTGGGAVLGAIIGGLVGNQFGGGSGKAAATAVGVVGGAAVGNSIEENNARAGSGNAWRFRVALDDGHWATVTQYQNPGVHPGDRVQIRGDHIEFLR